MKKLLLIFALTLSFFSQMNAQKEKLDQLFEKYQEADGVTSIKIAKPMFNMLNKLNIADEELSQIKPLLSKINSLKILILEKPEGAAAADQNQRNLFQKVQNDIGLSLKNMKYEELITVNSKDNKIKFLSSDAKNGILEDLLLNISADGNTVLMMLDGKISMDDVNTLVNEAQNSSLKSSVTTENTTPDGVTQVRNVGKFTGISASSGIKVNFTQGNHQTVVVETDPNMQKYVSTEVQNGILVISLKNTENKKINFKKLLVTVEAPRLASVKVSSGSHFTTVSRVTERDFTADISSGANLNADLNITNKTSVNISSGSSMRMDVTTNAFYLAGTSGSMATVTGNAETSTVKASSAASLNAQGLSARSVTADASSGANIKLSATQTLAAAASSGATIRYSGNPNTSNGALKMSSGGSIKTIN